MVNAILNGFFNVIIGLVSTLLAPIDSLINSAIPQFSSVLTSFANFLSYVLGFIPWGLSWFHIPTTTLTFVVYYLIAKITISATIHTIKIALAWWRTLKP